MPLLQVRELRTAQFGPIDFTLDSGGLLLVAGPSGSGKSRLLRALADLDPHEGEARLHDVAMNDMPAHRWRAQIGLLPAEPAWWEETALAHFPQPPSAERLERLALTPALLETPINRLSSGERQRLALLRLLARAPRVLLLDEPTANLDPDSAARVEALIAEYLSSTQAGALWVSHDPLQRQRLGARVLRLPEGRILPEETA